MDIELLPIYLSHISSLSVLIPFTLLLIKIKAFNAQLKALFAYVIISIVTEISGICFLNQPHINLPVYYLFTVIETILIIFLFIKEVNEQKYRYFFKIELIVFLIFSISFLICYKSFNRADDFLRPFEFVLILINSLIFFYKTFINLNIKNLLEYYFFWLNSAFLIYFGSSFILFLLLPYILTENSHYLNILGVFHLVMSIIYNILLSFGIWKIKRV